MNENKELEFLLNLSKLNSKIYRKLDALLWWIWFNDFIVLYYLNQAIDKKLRNLFLKIFFTQYLNKRKIII